MKQAHPEKQRIMAFDVGSKTCGVAATDPLGIFCQPLQTITYKGWQDSLSAFKQLSILVSELEPYKIVVGLPLHADQTESVQAKKVKNFITGFQKFLKTQAKYQLPLEWVFWNEHHSTQDAYALLQDLNAPRKKRDQVIDKMAAVLILKDYMDSVS